MLKGNEIRALRKAMRLTQSELAQQIGVSRSAVYDWERGAYFPEGENLIRLAKALHTTVSHLMGEAGCFISRVSSRQAVVNNPALGDVFVIPLYSGMHAATETEDSTGDNLLYSAISKYLYVPAKDLQGLPREPDSLFAVTVDSDSMAPLIMRGDYCVVNPNLEPSHGRIAYVSWNQYLMIRGMIFDKENNMTLRALNHFYRDETVRAGDVDSTEFKILGCIVLKISENKRISGFL